jgi:DNA-binding MarR family transcriptional regulator
MTSGHEVAMGLRAAYWAMHRQTTACLARRGVTADQFVLLALLAERDGTTQQELVRRACSDANTVRAMLVLLEKQGLVAREQHPADRRARSVVLTRKGRRMYERLWAQSEPLRQRLLMGLRPKEADTLVEFLARLCRAVTPSPAGKRGRPVKGEKR